MKKLIAAILTALMAISPLAMAADLGDYPGMLSEDGVLDAYVVVGAAADPADVVGAVDLAARLAAESYEAVSTSGGVVVSGGKSEDVNLGDAITTDVKATLDDDDLAGLQDTTITFDGDSYNVHDEVKLGSTGLKVQTSLSGSDDKYEDNVYLEVAKGDIAYYYVFDESINLSSVSSTTPLTINFLGSELQIIGITDADTLQAQVGIELSLSAGESATVDGKTVTLERTSSTAALVSVDGVSDSVSSGATVTINGLEVKVDTLFDDEGVENDFAVLVVGSNAIKSYDNQDPYVGEDEDDPDWIWDLNALTTSTSKGDTTAAGGPTIGIKNDFAKDGYNDDPAAVGEAYTLPGEFIEVELASLTVPEDGYMTMTMEFDTNIDLDNADDDGRSWGTSEDGLVLSSTVDESLVLDYSADGWIHKTGNFTADVNTDTVYVLLNSTANDYAEVFYEDDDNTELYAGDVKLNQTITTAGYANWGFVDYQETTGTTDVEFAFAGNATSGVYLIVQEELTTLSASYVNYDVKVKMNVTSGALVHLGATADTSEASEVTYTDGTTTHNLGTKDENHRTYYGMVLVDPDSNGASDKVVMQIPSDVVEATVVVSGSGTTTSSTSGAIRKVVPVSTAVAKLDTEISDPATVGKDLVLVGGPAVNMLTAQAMGLEYPTYGSSGLLPFAEGEGYIEYMDGAFATGQDVVVVCGWAAENTRDATSVLQQVDSFMDELAGNTAVKVTDVSSSGITAV